MSMGKPITHKDLILQQLDAIQLPRKVAIRKCAAHLEEANRAAASMNTVDDIYTTKITPTHIDHDILRDMQNSSPETEKNVAK